MLYKIRYSIVFMLFSLFILKSNIYANDNSINFLMNKSIPPIRYFTNNNFEGFEKDIIINVFKNNVYNLNYISNEDGLKTEKIDIYGLQIKGDNKDYIYSNTILNSNISIYCLYENSKYDINDIKTSKIGVFNDSLIEKIIKEKVGAKNYLKYDSLSDAIKLLEKNEIKYIVDIRDVVKYYLLKNNLENKVIEQFEKIDSIEICFAINKDRQDILKYTNNQLMIIKGNKTFDKIYEKYFITNEILNQSKINMYLIFTVVILLTLLFIISILRVNNNFLKRNMTVFKKEYDTKNKWLDVMLANIQDAFIAVDNNGSISSINKATEKLFGLGQTEILNKNIFEVLILMDQNSREIMKSDFNNIKKSIGTIRKNYIMISHKGEEYYIDSTIYSIKNDKDEFIGAIFILQNNTERINKDIELKKEQELIKCIFNTAPILIVVFDTYYNVVSVNTYFEKITGFSSDEIIGKNILGFYSEENYLNEIRYNLDELKNNQNEVIQNQEIFIISKDGKKTDILWNFSRLKNDNYILDGFIAIGVDISERKLAEKELQLSFSSLAAANLELEVAEDILSKQYQDLKHHEDALKLSEERYRITVEASNEGLWDWDIQNSKLFLSPRWKEILGYNDEDITNSLDSWISMIHTNDRDSVLLRINEHIKGKSEYFIAEYRMMNKKGEYVWISNRGKVQRDSNGIAIRMAGSHGDISIRKQYEEKIYDLAYVDHVTGLPNKVYFYEIFSEVLEKTIRNNEQGGIIFIDLDNFKNINDTVGHSNGDKLLKQIGKMIKSILGPNDVLAHFSADEFIILKPNIKNDSEIENIAKKVISLFQISWEVESYEFLITASAGISIFPLDGNDIFSMLKNADTAMYHSKEFGKNKYYFYDKSMNQKILKKIEMLAKLRKAIENDEFMLYYQPQIEVATGKIIAAEALIRWNSDNGEIIAPNDFIPLAEESGLIVQIGEWVIKTACKQNKIWIEKGLNPIVISVNISAKQLQISNLSERINRIIEDVGLENKYIDFEITETAAMQNINMVIKIVGHIRDMGMKISLDDFGTGYSSLTYLKKIPINNLKLDKMFVSELAENSVEESIAKTVIELAHSLNLKVIAEGVEEISQYYILKTLKCDILQGFLISKPLAVDEFEEFLEKTNYKITF